MPKLLDKYWGVFRRLKPAYHLFNMSKKSLLERNRALYREYGIRKSVFAPISSKDVQHLPDERPWSEHTLDISTHPDFPGLPEKIKAPLKAT